MIMEENSKSAIIDSIKGVAIILMVIGHSDAPFTNWIYLFHMAVFFIASGYCWNDKHSEPIQNVKKYVIKKIKNLYCPCVLVNGTYLLFNNLFVKYGIYSASPEFIKLGGGNARIITIISQRKMIKELLKIVLFLSGSHTQLAGAFWFVRCLFIVNVGHCLVSYVDKKLGMHEVFGKVALIVSIIMAHLVNEGNLVFLHGFKSVFSAYIVYVIGMKLKQYDVLNGRVYTIRGALASFILLCILSNYGTISMAEGKIVNILFFLLASLLGWIFLNAISLKMDFCKGFMRLLNESSLWIMALHFLAFKLVSWIYIKLLRLPIVLLASFPVIQTNNKVLWVPYSAVGLIIPVLCYSVYKKLCRFSK